MGTYNTKEFENALQKKGFREDETHHNMFWFYYDDKKSSIRTRTSHNEKEYDETLLGERKKQMRLTKKQFISFIDCSLSENAYRQYLIEENHIRLTKNKES